ncbi:unnamed protein product [Spirodela intermedia]|uniref:TAFII-230 TBP-binding domain-containing protein n=1 Tax=Spirodela intermedia TaxID=51605 RepID=A0A7I8IRN9_SPIIN|nr:unnamed protein product [Spirodela intermedia]CAA6659834.1 unnamed protein product [Spirodela intermedia]
MEDGGGDSITPHDAPDEDDEDEYEEQGGGSRLLGFMFGNVDCSGDLDADYLDEDAKEHLSALADKLGPSLTGIDMTKSPSTVTDASEQDYDEKAENAVDYEDIDEQYEGPEVQSIPEENSLLAEDYFSRNISISSITHKVPLFDEENYDEDDDNEKENEFVEVKSDAEIFFQQKLEPFSNMVESQFDGISVARSSEDDQTAFDSEDFQFNDSTSGAALPVLCVEDGTVILRFSEIFGIHEPLKKMKKRDKRSIYSSIT